MSRMHKRGGLSAFLNQASQKASQEENENKVVRIPITQIQDNPKNFYGLRDIEGLAKTIAFTKFVDPLIVIQNSGENRQEKPYLLVAGHRRKAAWQKLLDDGTVEDTTLPCIVRTFQPYIVHLPDGTTREISAARMEEAFLMFSNMGQRQMRTIDERLQEVKELEPLARDLYEGIPKGNGKTRGDFRTFFAESILETSPSNLQRLLSLQNITEQVKEAIDGGKISITLGAGLSSLPPDEQDAYLKSIESGERKGTTMELDAYKKAKKESGEESDSLPSDFPGETEPEENIDSKQGGEADTSFAPDEPDEPEGEAATTGEEAEPEDSPDFPEDEPETAEDEPEPEPPSEAKPKKSRVLSDKEISMKVDDVPKTDFDPRQEADAWVKSQTLRNYENLVQYSQAQINAYNEKGEDLAAAQWNMRISALRVQMILLQKKG